MVLVPVVVAVGTGAAIVIRKINSDQEYQEKVAEIDRRPLESQMKNSYGRYESYLKNGELGKAIQELKNYISLFKKVVPSNPDKEKSLDKTLESLIFRSQESALVLKREFKVTRERLEEGDPFALHAAHLDYIKRLKVVLPEGDAFLEKEISDFDREYPPVSIHD